MLKTELQAIYIMWLRQMKRYFRSRGRIIGSIVQPLFFLVILGSGFRTLEMSMIEGDYLIFLAPGIVTMSILFSSLFTGISILWDKQFGFLQEVLVAPISRISIVVGRTLGGTTTALIQGFIILAIAVALKVPITNIFGFILTIILMILVAFTAVGFGLILASKMEDFQGFQIIMNLIFMPLLFLSGAFFPIANNKGMPAIIQQVAYFNPLFYMVDGIRGSLTGVNNVLDPLQNLGILLAIATIMIFIGSYMFSKSEV